MSRKDTLPRIGAGKIKRQRWRVPLPRQEGAFSLIEVLVVAGLIVVLAALLQPVLQQIKSSGQAAKCVANLHAIGSAMQLYINDHQGCFPPYAENLPPDNKAEWMPNVLIHLYDINVQAFYCPTQKNPGWQNPTDSRARIDYGYNYLYIGSMLEANKYASSSQWIQDGRPTPKATAIPERSRIMVLVENLYYEGSPQYKFGNVQGYWKNLGGTRLDPRHFSRMNVLWADFHVSQEAVTTTSSGEYMVSSKFFIVK